jgi:hypothetical protein
MKVTDKAARRVDMINEIVRGRVTGPSRERLLAIGQLVGFRGVYAVWPSFESFVVTLIALVEVKVNEECRQ